MRKLFILYYIIIAFCVISCNDNTKRECIYDNFIREYSKGDFESDIPPINFGYLFFAETNDGFIIITNNFYLYQIFKKYYLQEFSDFHNFLCSLYKGKTVLQEEYLNEVMSIDNFIFKNDSIFENSNLSDLKKKYLIDNQYLKSNISLTKNEVFSLLYHFFKNQYYVLHDDYSGSYSIRNEDCNGTNQ